MFPIRDTVPARHRPVMTWILIAVNVAIYLSVALLPEDTTRGLFFVYGLVPARFTDAAWVAQTGLGFSLVPFLSNQFLHGGLLHLAGNLWMLWIFGDNVEDRMGPVRFLGFYLATGVAAGLLHLMTNFTSAIPAVGASGAIAGVLGAYVRLYPGARVLAVFPILFYPLFFEVSALIYIGLWFVIQLLSGAFALFMSEGAEIAWWAHVGGFVAGMVLVRFFLRASGRPEPAGGAAPEPQERGSYPGGRQAPPLIEIHRKKR